MIDEITAAIEEGDEDAAYRLIKSSAKTDGATKDIDFYERMLSSEYDMVKAGALHALLFALKLDKRSYLEAAVKYSLDESVEYELRQEAISGIGQAYMGTRNREALECTSSLKSDPDSDVAALAFKSMLMIVGLSSVDIFKRVGYLDKVNDDVRSHFNSEIKEVEILLQA